MKKMYQIIMLCVSFLFMVSCSKNYQQEIEKACEESDFAKAYEILAEMKNKDADGLYRLEEFVHEKEVMFLISQGDDDSSKRLSYLLKEKDISKDQICRYLDLALNKDNGLLIQALTNEFVKKISLNSDDSEAYREEEKYVALILDKCIELKIQEPVIALYNKLEASKYDVKFIQDGMWLSGLVLGSKVTLDVLSALMSFNDENTNNIIKNIITQSHSKIGNAHTDYRDDGLQCNLTDSNHERYSKACSNIMAAAISKRNKTIAEFVCSQAEPLCEIKHKSDGYTHCYILHYDNVKELKQMYENANFE